MENKARRRLKVIIFPLVISLWFFIIGVIDLDYASLGTLLFATLLFFIPLLIASLIGFEIGYKNGK